MSKTISTYMYILIQINRIKHLLDTRTLVFVIKSFVFSSTVWSNTSKGNLCPGIVPLDKFDEKNVKEDILLES